MTQLIEKFNDGGPFFTYSMLITLFAVLIIFSLGLVRKINHNKTVDLLSSIGWFSVALGFLGRTFGLIKAFDMVAAQGELTPRLLAGGLKMALIDPLFGITVFLIARIGIIYLISIRKTQE